MASSTHYVRKDKTMRVRALIIFVVITMLIPFSPDQAKVFAEDARNVTGPAFELIEKIVASPIKNRVIAPASQETSIQRALSVTRVRLCPRRLLMYVGEEFVLSPLPLDSSGNPVHGVAFSWGSSDGTIVTVGSDGVVAALKSGRCVVTASVGNKSDLVNVEVREGDRPALTNEQWNLEHAGDCSDPEQSHSSDNAPAVIENQSLANETQNTLVPLDDPDDPQNVPNAPSPLNGVGHPRFTPRDGAMASVTGAETQLGSSNFNFTVPIVGLPGRGLDVGLALAYNSRMWTKEGDEKIVFDYDQGWPAPGFRLEPWPPHQ